MLEKSSCPGVLLPWSPAGMLGRELSCSRVCAGACPGKAQNPGCLSSWYFEKKSCICNWMQFPTDIVVLLFPVYRCGNKGWGGLGHLSMQCGQDVVKLLVLGSHRLSSNLGFGFVTLVNLFNFTELWFSHLWNRNNIRSSSLASYQICIVC